MNSIKRIDIDEITKEKAIPNHVVLSKLQGQARGFGSGIRFTHRKVGA
jgi:hypothetical protein